MRYVFIQFICTCIQVVCVCVCVCICIVFVIIELFLLLLLPCHSLKNHCSNRWIFHRLKLKYYPDWAQWWERAISGWSRRGRAGRGQSTRITYYLWLRVPVRVSCTRLCVLALSLFGCQCLFNISLLTSCRVCERVCVWVWERVWCLHSFRCLACSSFTLFAFRCWISLKFAPICHNLYFFYHFFFRNFSCFFFLLFLAVIRMTAQSSPALDGAAAAAPPCRRWAWQANEKIYKRDNSYFVQRACGMQRKRETEREK